MLNKPFLYQTLDALNQAGMLSKMPEFITHNLAPHIELRDYQIQAFRNFATYYENDNLSKNKQIHTLFHMATGSGKTVIMAGLFLYLYTRGYRKFLFFVDQTNILEKTKLNFMDKKSGKYLLADTIEYLGKKINLKSVANFAATEALDDDIYICFTSTQKLHLDLFAPRENSLTFEDFENNKIVFISDESHHVNTMTKRATKSEIENKKSWEYSVMNAFQHNKDNILLEFTATADVRDKNVTAKYRDKMIMNYPLAEFRQSGYTKDFQNFATDSDLWTRALMACVISEYRRYLFADVKQNIKPVIMMKSQKIKESEAFYNSFFEHMSKLSIAELQDLRSYKAMKPLQKALDYFANIGSNYAFLKQSLQDSFTKETSIIMNGASDDNPQNQILVNSLEDKKNPIRVIFAVDMLNEGWDVLNLFDIIRLYDTRQSKSGGKVGTYTIKEAQLIGRAARYCPFVVDEGQERFKRKYDSDIENDYRYLETMYFHSKDDSRYIAELKKALIATGLQDKEEHILEYQVKDEFKSSDLYFNGLVFSNKRKEKPRDDVKGMEASLRNKIYYYYQSSSSGSVHSLFDDEKELSKQSEKVETIRVQFKDLPYNILVGASELYQELSFSVLLMKYPNLKSLREFLTSENYIGDSIIEMTYSKNLTGKDYYRATVNALSIIARHVTDIRQEYEGTRTFAPKRLKNILKDKKIVLSDIDANGGKGTSQINSTNKRYKLDLDNKGWYVFNDNYGTSEEKLFLRYFDTEIASKLEEKGLEFYVIRNERVADLAIYSFEDGERFEPDFLIFLRKKTGRKFSSQQVYVEPKGSHLLLHDKWKEDFLAQITEQAKVDESYTFGYNYAIIGMPFFNEENRRIEFGNAINAVIEDI